MEKILVMVILSVSLVAVCVPCMTFAGEASDRSIEMMVTPQTKESSSKEIVLADLVRVAQGDSDNGERQERDRDQWESNVEKQIDILIRKQERLELEIKKLKRFIRGYNPG